MIDYSNCSDEREWGYILKWKCQEPRPQWLAPDGKKYVNYDAYCAANKIRPVAVITWCYGTTREIDLLYTYEEAKKFYESIKDKYSNVKLTYI